MAAWQASIRRACSVLKAERLSYRYKGKRRPQAVLSKRIKEIAETRVLSSLVGTRCFRLARGPQSANHLITGDSDRFYGPTTLNGHALRHPVSLLEENDVSGEHAAEFRPVLPEDSALVANRLDSILGRGAL